MKREGFARLEGGRYVGIDHGEGDVTTYCEGRIEPDGTIVIEDIYELPQAPRPGRKVGR